MKDINRYIVFPLENHDAVYIVGSLEETLLIRGMRYHPIDIENTVMRTHKRICEWYRKAAGKFYSKP